MAFDSADLVAYAQRALTAAGMRSVDADPVARSLVEANLRGVDTHGVARLPQYVGQLQAGAINLSPNVTLADTAAAAAIVDADGGYGYRPSQLAIRRAIELANEKGIGFVAVQNSHHFGMASTYTRVAADEGRIGFCWTNASPKIVPPGSVMPAVGNNPLSWAIPTSDPEEPVVLDMALSTVAFGKIRLARTEGRAIPTGWGLDSRGLPTTDAEAAFQSGLLDAIGGHKGYGLAVIAEILAGCLTGSPYGAGSSPHDHPHGGVGHVFLVLRPDLFVSGEQFRSSVEQLRQELHAISLADGSTALLPGELENRMFRQRSAQGIELSTSVIGELVALARSLEVDDRPFADPVSGRP